MEIELAVVEVYVILIDVFDAEAVHHQRACGNGLWKIFLSVTKYAFRPASGDPVTHVQIVDGILDDQVAGARHILVPDRPRLLRFGLDWRAVTLRLDDEGLPQYTLF